MNYMNQKITSKTIDIVVIIILILANTYYQFHTTTKISKINQELSTNTTRLDTEIAQIGDVIKETKQENVLLAEALDSARRRVEDISEEFEDVTDNVKDLEKIAKTDRELLQKYSKVYFLNEHYAPSGLETIPSKWTYDKGNKYEIHEKVEPFLLDLLDEAEDDGMDILVISAFRSFGEQAQLKGAYTIQYGAGSANTFSADQGYSEHQLGTTVDFTTPEVGASYTGFSLTEEYEWLQDNAHKYGFTLSYPLDNDYYQFEPWHWRFVGEDLADDLHDDNDHFYGLSQREIDKYIVNLFD